MIEACSSNPSQNGSSGSGNNSMFNDPFFASDNFGTNSMDDLDGNDIFGILGDERGGGRLNDGGYGNLDDDLHLSNDQPFLSTLSSDSQYPSNHDETGFLSPVSISTSSDGQHSSGHNQTSPDNNNPPGDYPPPPSPVVIDPTEIDKISIQLEKNQQCRCKSCNKLFNSVWYLKQHAVKHSNDRPFQCKFCRKTYKFRSNLYQHKCPERNRQLGQPNGIRKRFYTRGIAYSEGKGDPNNPSNPQSQQQQHQSLSATKTPSTNTTPATEIPDNSLSAPYEPQGGFQIPSIDQHSSSDIQFNLIPVDPPPLQHHQRHPEPQQMMIEKKPSRPENSIRERQLDPAYIEDYLARKRHKLFTCRKCKFQFPSRGHLSAHMTAHSLAEAYCYICPQCPQKFCEERRLRNHLELHSSDPNSACHRCRQCDGAFRSALALRRHIDQSRACYSHPFGIKPQMMIAPVQPIDPYAFIESDEENENKNAVPEEALGNAIVGGVKRQKSIGDSGAGSDASSNTTSPPRNSTLEEEYDEKTPEDSSFLPKRSKKSSENEDADSGFRSRLNSNLSCSPSSHSAISSGSDSPGRKYSTGHDYGTGHNNNNGYEAGPSGSSGSSSSYSNGCYPTNSSSRINIPPPTAHYSYGMIEEVEDEFGMDSEDLGCQFLQKQVSTRNFRLIHSMKANAADNEFINRISDIPSDDNYSIFGVTNSSNGFPLETFESTEPVIETSKELRAILAIFLNALIETAKKTTTRHQT